MSKHTCGLSAEDRRCNADGTCEGCVGKWAVTEKPIPKDDRPDDYSHLFDDSNFIKIESDSVLVMKSEIETLKAQLAAKDEQLRDYEEVVEFVKLESDTVMNPAMTRDMFMMNQALIKCYDATREAIKKWSKG